MAEAVLFNIAEEIVTKLASNAWQEIGLRWGVKDELEKLRSTIFIIVAVLVDGEKLSLESIQVKNFLAELKDAIYDAEDLLDEISTEALRQQGMTGNKVTKKVRFLVSSPKQLAYGLQMARKVKAIRDRLEEILVGAPKEILVIGEQIHSSAHEVIIGREKDEETLILPKGAREQTHSFAPGVVVGREQDKDAIIELLLFSNVEENVSTLPIVGMGGLGKTALAQLVYNDEKITSHFELRIWVCVSDCFDVKLIVERMIESASYEKPTCSEMAALKFLIHRQIEGKKFLIVLDDIWNEDPDKWFLLKDLLGGGARGSKIMITTRLRKAAELMRPFTIYELQGLSEVESWSLFKQMAFKSRQVPSPSHESIGKEIVERCLGVPLAIKTIGDLLYSKASESEWQCFKDKKLSEVDEHDSGILQTLKLSYNHLPIHLKRCFSYCSLFPKDYTINVELLIQLWIAEGYVKSSDTNQCLGEIGVEYFADLLGRSCFQKVVKDEFGNYETCKMHGLMHDLATFVAGEECASSSNSEVAISNAKTRHALFHFDWSLQCEISPSLFKANKLRTLLFAGGQSHIKERHCHEIFSNLRCLRVLGLHDSRIVTLPSSIYRLKHLRHLDLSQSGEIKTLPNSITNLQNLQVLKLNGCKQLSQLPKDMKKLVNLTHLENDDCDALTHLPCGIGQLTSLEKLSVFVVAKDSSVSKLGAGLSELCGLNQLRGQLGIRNLGRVKNAAMESEAANLKEKRHLQGLLLDWNHYPFGNYSDRANASASEVENDEMALKALEPHQDLKGLSVIWYMGVKLPWWLSSLTNLVSISFTRCNNIKCLPSFDKLPSLKRLWIFGLANLEYINVAAGLNFYSHEVGALLFFPSLIDLQLGWNPNLKGWNVEKSDLLQFPCLSDMKIRECPNLILMPRSPSLKRLFYEGSTAKSFEQILERAIMTSEYTSSSHSQLEDLRIWNIEDLKFLPMLLLPNLASLQRLEIVGCLGIATLSPDDEDEEMQWQGLKSLHFLEFRNIPNLESLPKGLQYVTSLRSLEIFRCPNLTSLPWDNFAIVVAGEEQTSSSNSATVAPPMKQHTSLPRPPLLLYSDNTALKEVISRSKIPTDKESSSEYQESEKATKAVIPLLHKATASQIQEGAGTSSNGIVTFSSLTKTDRILDIIVENVGNPQIGKIGIYGRGGVGKTILMEALKVRPVIRKMFDFVIWVTIPKVLSLREIQLEILRQLPSKEIDEEHINLQRLFTSLEPLKVLLILDDVYQAMKLDLMGFPVPSPQNGHKILLTTRSEQVCKQMSFHSLNLEDLLSWELFCENVGEIVDSLRLQLVARQVVDMCCHYSQVIILMARALKGETGIGVWRNALETLSMQPASNEEKFQTLMVNVKKFTYSRLKGDASRKCIRNCALFCENQNFARKSLIESWISDGLIGSFPEGNEVLETLLSAGLLESSEDEEVVKLQETDRCILLEHIFPPIEGRFFLLRCGMGLTELPKDVEWEMLSEISLMDNELSELTENLICPKARVLFLQRNLKLRTIHDSFFDQMSALEVLNLSRTRIKSLPKSLFRLVNLRRLFLNHCDLLLTLPHEVGELKCLELLDLEGTAIIDLPEEVNQLSNLTCLKVSFCEPVSFRRSEQVETIIPRGVLSTLSKLEELSIDVSPEDERWNASVEDVVCEVCRLTSLMTLKFYFPTVELLRSFQSNTIPMVSPPLSHFSFTLGDHAKRIITRLPRDVEFELDQYDKCLKYINGEGVPEEIMMALKHASAFFLDRHKTATKLSEFGMTNITQLKCCVIGECEDLQTIIDGDQLAKEAFGDTMVGLASLEYLYIYYAKNLNSLWKGEPLYNSSFLLLKHLTLYMCPELSTIFTPGMIANLSSLEELTLDDCPKITRLITCNPFEEEIKHGLPALKKISLHFLPELVDISEFLQIAPSIEWMSFYYCPNLKTLPISTVFHKNLRKIKGELHWWQKSRPKATEQVSLDDIFTAIDECD